MLLLLAARGIGPLGGKGRGLGWHLDFLSILVVYSLGHGAKMTELALLSS
jgi:hypothetical protein